MGIPRSGYVFRLVTGRARWVTAAGTECLRKKKGSIPFLGATHGHVCGLAAHLSGIKSTAFAFYMCGLIYLGDTCGCHGNSMLTNKKWTAFRSWGPPTDRCVG